MIPDEAVAAKSPYCLSDRGMHSCEREANHDGGHRCICESGETPWTARNHSPSEAVLEVPEHLRGEDNATTVRAMLARLERKIK